MFRFESRVLFLRWLLLLALGLGCGYFAWTESFRAALGLAALSVFKVYGWLWPYLRARLSLLCEGRAYEDPEYRVEVPSGWKVEREVSSDPSCVTLTLDGPDYLITLKVLPGLGNTSSMTKERCEELLPDDYKALTGNTSLVAAIRENAALVKAASRQANATLQED